MSERPPTMLTLSTRHLSADGARVTPDGNVPGVEVTPTAALAALKAFAHVPGIELVDVDAKIILAGPRGKFGVQNINGKLFATKMLGGVNTAVEQTPEGVIQLLVEADPNAASTIAAAAAAEEAELIAAVESMPAGPRAWMNSGWLIGVAAVAAAAVAYFTFTSDTPEGVAIIHDSARIASLHADYDGRYGDPAATVMVLNHGVLTGQQPGAVAGTEEKIFEMHYRFGLRDGQVVLIVDNGALLEPQPDKSLDFATCRYARLATK